MAFPYFDAPLRTDENFRNRTQPEHHSEEESSPLEELPIDMIKCFPTSDPLHLLELGIMKKLLFIWIYGSSYFTGK